jgi:stalled ribosome rescue protein Dom34
MKSALQTAIWIDHHEAHVVRLRGEQIDETVVAAPAAHAHRHPKGPSAEHNHPDDLRRFFGDVLQAIDGADELLIVGPSTAKEQFAHYLEEHRRDRAPYVTLETADHPSDAQLVQRARAHFEAPRSHRQAAR